MFKRQKKTAGEKDKRYQNGNIEKGMKIAVDAFLYASFLVRGWCIHYPISFSLFFCNLFALFLFVFFVCVLLFFFFFFFFLSFFSYNFICC